MRIIFTLLVFITIVLPLQILLSQNSNSNKWKTDFEKSGYLVTETYAQTVEYFNMLAEASPYAKMTTFGVSPQGRELYCLIVSKDKTFTPESSKKKGKPVILIENGIHAGEIEGKDASMLLLREILITKEKENLIDNCVLLVVPIFNVDGHERFGKYNRINQNGPVNMGWRTTSQNLNLNRDWTKADAPEMQAMLKFFSAWLPDFFIDTHTTDGADYQYTITYAMEKFDNIYGGTSQWLKRNFIPFMEKKVNDAGFLIAPYLSFVDHDVSKGIVDWAATPRFSQGYAAIQNRPGLLVETHMLKPYKDRVFSTKAILNSVIEYVNDHPRQIIDLNKNADDNSINVLAKGKQYLALSFRTTDKSKNFLFKGIKYKIDTSEISGGERIAYTGEKFEKEVPYYEDIEVKDSVLLPKEYLIPVQWKNIIERMKLHGINVDVLNKSKKFIVTEYKFKNVEFVKNPYEGRQTVTCDYDEFKDTVLVPAGTFIIKTNQRTARVIGNLLEPKGPDSFLRWGFFNTIFERTEYFESYVMEKVAAKMIKDNPELKKEFEDKLESNTAFAESPRARLNFFYERSPYYDKEYLVYPVMRVD